MATFKEAFAAARKGGAKTFSWNGKKYTTKLKSEAAKGKSNPPSKVPVPQPKPPSKVPVPQPKPSGNTPVKTGPMVKVVSKERMQAAIKSASMPSVKPSTQAKADAPAPKKRETGGLIKKMRMDTGISKPRAAATAAPRAPAKPLSTKNAPAGKAAASLARKGRPMIKK